MECQRKNREGKNRIVCLLVERKILKKAANYKMGSINYKLYQEEKLAIAMFKEQKILLDKKSKIMYNCKQAR